MAQGIGEAIARLDQPEPQRLGPAYLGRDPALRIDFEEVKESEPGPAVGRRPGGGSSLGPPGTVSRTGARTGHGQVLVTYGGSPPVPTATPPDPVATLTPQATLTPIAPLTATPLPTATATTSLHRDRGPAHGDRHGRGRRRRPGRLLPGRRRAASPACRTPRRPRDPSPAARAPPCRPRQRAPPGGPGGRAPGAPPAGTAAG